MTMSQKIVSYNVAKALKEAGYPQECKDGTIYYAENGLKWKYDSETYDMYDDPVYCICLTYIDAWLWLWNTKNIKIEVADKPYFAKAKVMGKFFVETNPEEAIAKAIDYLIENNLIK